MKSHWNQRFSREEFLYGEHANQFIKEIEPILQLEGHLLAIAEGEGRNALHLAREAKKAPRHLMIDVWDYSDVALKKLNTRKGELSIKTQEVDLTQVHWLEDQYDAACCVYGHFDQLTQETIFKGLRKTVKNGGWIFGEVYSQEQLAYGSGGPRDSEYLYTGNLFFKLFKEDFFKHFYIGEKMRSEGDLHQGLSHVIQFAIQIRK